MHQVWDLERSLATSIMLLPSFFLQKFLSSLQSSTWNKSITKQLCIFSLFRGEHTHIWFGFFFLMCSITEINSSKILFQELHSNIMTLSHLQGAGEVYSFWLSHQYLLCFIPDLLKEWLISVLCHAIIASREGIPGEIILMTSWLTSIEREWQSYPIPLTSQ